MVRGKKIGVILILTGLCIPILAMLFTSNYYPSKGFIWNVKETEIILREKRSPTAIEYLGRLDEKGKTVKTKDNPYAKITDQMFAPPKEKDIFEEVAKEQTAKTSKYDPLNILKEKVKVNPPAGFVPIESVKFDEVVPAIYVPYSIFFGLGIILTAIGIGFVIISKNVRENSSTE